MCVGGGKYYEQEKNFFYGIYEYEDGFAWTKPYASILIQNENIKENGLEIDLAIPDRKSVV